jgi:hypothetical protein
MTSTTRSRLRRWLLVGTCVALLGAFAVPAASAGVVKPSNSPFGRTYAAWDVVWGTAQAKRALASKNSLLAQRANRCGFAWSQRVWLLPASINGHITVHCHVPAGSYLMFPVAGVVSWGLPPDQMRAEIRTYWEYVADAELWIDGRSVRPGYVTRTPIYVADVPRGNAFGVPKGSLNLMSKDHFAIIAPLSRGHHVITAIGSFTNPTTELGMTYHLHGG